MAYLLYKYINKSLKERKARKANAPADGFENIGEDQQAPASVAGRLANSNPAETPENGSPQLRMVDEKQGSNVNSTSTEPKKSVDTRTKEEKKAQRIYRLKLVVGLFLPFSVQALETTIIAGALPFIASDFSTSAAMGHPNNVC